MVKRHQTFDRRIVAVCIFAIANFAASTVAQSSLQPIVGNLSDKTISELLSNLDSPKFSIRQAATEELTSRGNQALYSLAKHYLTSSPEAAWRIKSCLEEIGIRGNEETFLKSVGMLQVLVGSSNLRMTEQLERLKFEWQKKRTLDAIKLLRQAGAIIDDIAKRNYQITTRNSTQTNPNPKRSSPELPTSEKLSLLKKISKGSVDDNRRLVLGNDDPLESDQEADEVLNALERQIANRVVIRGGRPVNVSSRPGVIVKFGQNWKGKKSDFEQLQYIGDLNQIVLQDQYIDRSKLEVISKLRSVRSLDFDRCRFSGPAMATIGLPKYINDIRFRNQDVEVSMIDRIGKLPVRSLVFENCDFSSAALKKMLAMDSLAYLELVKQKLSDADFKRLEKLDNLSSLKLSNTRFPFKSYKKLTQVRPDLYIDFTTSAFLGVRSVQGLNDSCTISEVISGSGAEAGGIQTDDVITHVNGFAIGKFNDLRAHIALHQPDDTLRMTIQRDGENKELKVKLGSIDQAPIR